jgi:hypothetical protein
MLSRVGKIRATRKRKIRHARRLRRRPRTILLAPPAISRDRRHTPAVNYRRMTAAALPAISSDQYRREARRLRCRHAGRPDRLQRSLKTLATRVTLPPANQDTVAPTQVGSARVCTGPAATFAERLAEQIPSSGILTYSARLQLLREAHRLGIGRFEANLLIAAGLQRRRDATTTRRTADIAARGAFSPVVQLVTFLLIQGAFALVAWWTLFR